MFSKVAIVVAASFALFAAAIPTGYGGGGEGSSCSTGPVQCCNSVQDAHSAQASKLLGLLNIDVSQITGQVGITCTPISAVIGLSGNHCNAQSVCCQKTHFNGLVALGCTPINVGL